MEKGRKMKGRFICLCTLALLAGDFFGGWIALPPPAYLALASAAALLSLLRPSTVPVLLAFFLLGAASVQVSRMPPARGESLLEARFAAVKARVSAQVGGLVAEPEGQAVLKALAVGDRSAVGRSLKEEYRRSGAMHLLALSGLHVGIIYKMICGMLFFMGTGPLLRRIRSFIVLAFLWWFALMTGLSPSIARASLMITVYELSPIMRSGKDGIRALSVAALFIVLANPEAPRGIGFQLSFCACLSLFTLFPFLRGLLDTRSRVLTLVWDSLCVAIACQAATAPLSYCYFGTFPRYFLVTNLLAVPVAGSVLYLTAASLLFPDSWALSSYMADLLSFALKLLNALVRLISGL